MDVTRAFYLDKTGLQIGLASVVMCYSSTHNLFNESPAGGSNCKNKPWSTLLWHFLIENALKLFSPVYKAKVVILKQQEEKCS